MDGEIKEEVFAIGGNYIVNMGGIANVYPWFFTASGQLDILEDVPSTVSRKNEEIEKGEERREKREERREKR